MERKTLVLKQDEDGFMVASTPAVDRDNDRVMPLGAKVDNFQNNSVLMFGHNYREPWALIGKASELRIDDSGIRFRPELREPANEQDPMNVVRALWDQKLLRAASIGFDPLDWEENDFGGRDFTSWELLEISLVPIPANQDALRLAAKAIDDINTKKGVIGYKKTPLADKGRSWDGPAQVSAAEVDDLRVMCTWFDSDNSDNKSAYKLPHHLASGEHACVWRGVTAAMGALLGARGGVSVPDSDRRGIYNHLRRHYSDFDEEAPEFREYSDAELKELFPEFMKDDETDEQPAAEQKDTPAAVVSPNGDLDTANEPDSEDEQPDTAELDGQSERSEPEALGDSAAEDDDELSEEDEQALAGAIEELLGALEPELIGA